MSTMFLYTPQSGSKLVADPGWGVTVNTRPWGEGHTAEKAAGSHDVEAHDVVRADSAAPMDHWRDEGCRWLALLVTEAGGAAADDRGELLYFAPNEAAANAARQLFALLGKSAEQRARLEMELSRDAGAVATASWYNAQRALSGAKSYREETQRRALAERLGAEEAAP